MNKFYGNYTLVSDALIKKYNRIYEALLFGYIWRKAQMKEGYCYMSFPNIAKELGISLSTVKRAKKVLLEDNLIIDVTPFGSWGEKITRRLIPNYELFKKISSVSQNLLDEPSTEIVRGSSKKELPDDEGSVWIDESSVSQIDSSVSQIESSVRESYKEYIKNTYKNTIKNNINNESNIPGNFEIFSSNEKIDSPEYYYIYADSGLEVTSPVEIEDAENGSFSWLYSKVTR